MKWPPSLSQQKTWGNLFSFLGHVTQQPMDCIPSQMIPATVHSGPRVAIHGTLSPPAALKNAGTQCHLGVILDKSGTLTFVNLNRKFGRNCHQFT